jgi:primosomal protein N' (replication factor Y)
MIGGNMYCDVLIELSSFNIDKTFTYKVPSNTKILVGSRVLVPFSNQKLEGFVLNIKDNIDDIDYEVKEIIDVIDQEPILNEELLSLGKILSDKTVSTLISCYQVMLPKALKANHKVSSNIKYVDYVKVINREVKLTDKQQLIINEFNNKKEVPYLDLKKINSSVDTLIKNKVLEKYKKETYRYNRDEEIEDKYTLTKDQEEVVKIVKDNLNTNKKYLLYGVTGSGKTICYMDIIEEVINKGMQAILLVPEITLTTQIEMRFRKRFKRIAILHSGLSDSEKYDEYRKIKRGEVDIVIGARSAIFAPLSNIGIVIIDECHSDTYKQENMPKYDAKEVALERCKYHNCPIILGSATPDIMDFAKCQKKIYELLVLKHRVGNAKLPSVIISDMTKEKKINNTSFSEKLYNEVINETRLGHQVILLINRRGYSSSVMCEMCGNVLKCPHCDISYTYHKSKDILRCHYCGLAINKPVECPTCHTKSLKESGTGTERIEEEIKSLFNARVVRMDLDTTTKKGSHEKIINDFKNQKYDILLGTQMISKGLDFPNVTLVGVINADTSLFIPSYKSPERTFELLSQVSGRSGRSTKPGEVIIQTYNSDHYAINLASKNDYINFYNEEMRIRRDSKYPPYFYLSYVIVKSKDYEYLSKEVNRITNLLKSKLPNFEILGPSVCTPFKINNICRFGILIKYKNEDNLLTVLRDLIDHYKSNNKIRIEVDFNPNNI